MLTIRILNAAKKLSSLRRIVDNAALRLGFNFAQSVSFARDATDLESFYANTLSDEETAEMILILRTAEARQKELANNP